LLSGRALYGYGIDLAAADRSKRLFRFRQPQAQFFQLASSPADRLLSSHFSFVFRFRSSSTRTRPRSDKSPIMQRTGSCLTRVGAAMTLAREPKK
jgi:hypothetical protein